MDFDFSTNEKGLFKQLESALRDLTTDRDFEGTTMRPDLDAALDRLAALPPYLSLAVTDVSTESGTAALLAAMERVAATSPSLCLAVESSTRVLGRALAEHGSDQQKEWWLDPMIEGRHLGALALSETTMNVVNDPLTTSGELHDGSYRVTGHKGLVVNATVADVFGVVGLVNGNPALFLIKKDRDGLTIDDPLGTAGFQGASIAPITLDHCTVPTDDVVILESEGTLLSNLKRWENLVMIGIALGLMKRSFEVAKQHARTHATGGRPIIKYQEVSFKLAEMLTLYQTSQLLAFRAGWALDAGESEADGLVECAKVFCTESAEQVSSAALSVLSAAGFVTPNPVENAYRCAKYLQIAGTSSEIARVHIGDDALTRWG